MNNNLDEKFREVHELSMKFWCEDTPEAKNDSLSINAKVSDKAKQVHRNALIIDSCSFSLEGFDWHLEEAKATAINCTVIGTKDSACESLRNIIDYYSTIENTPELKLILNSNDILQAKVENKTGIIIGAQNSQFLHHNDIEAAVSVFSRLGLRITTLAYNWSSFAADGCYSRSNGGLSKEGKVLIKALEKFGVVVDLSHVGERSTLDALEFCDHPPIFSHSNPLNLFNHPRNISDEQAKKCAERDGVIGVTSFPVTLWEVGKAFPTIENFVDCIVYYADIVGIDHVGIGIDSNANAGAYERRKIINLSQTTKEMQGQNSLGYKSNEARRQLLGSYLEGLESLANMVNIVDKLIQRRFSTTEINKIMGENWLEVFKKCWD